MSKYLQVIDFNSLVMDYAAYGEVMKWDSKNLTFRPYSNGKTFLNEKEIK
jgi:hypothetical protein